MFWIGLYIITFLSLVGIVHITKQITMTFTDQVIDMIKSIRRDDKRHKYADLLTLLYDNQSKIKDLNTRWMVSVCDTIADKDLVDGPAAMLIVVYANMVKLTETWRYINLETLNRTRLDHINSDEIKVFPLWDGMTTFHLRHGDMTRNMIKRIYTATDRNIILKIIWSEVLHRSFKYPTFLSTMNDYHGKMY